jgi:hypothetical protein
MHAWTDNDAAAYGACFTEDSDYVSYDGTRAIALLREWPKMPTPVIAQRIGWPSSYSDGPLKKLLARIRPEYVGIDPVDRVTYEPGVLTQCDLWFPTPRIPVGPGQLRVLPVLVMTFGDPTRTPPVSPRRAARRSIPAQGQLSSTSTFIYLMALGSRSWAAAGPAVLRPMRPASRARSSRSSLSWLSIRLGPPRWVVRALPVVFGRSRSRAVRRARAGPTLTELPADAAS